MFVSTEVWAPSWRHCEREARPPNVFLHLLDRTSGTSDCLPVVVLAVAADADPAAVAAGDAAMQSAAELLQATAHGRARRPWGRSTGGGFADAIADLALSPNLIHASPTNRRRLPPTWEAIG
jgi:hypothetical protein